MHHALEIQEILLIIFGYCRPGLPSRRRGTSDLVALAQTCRTFKEPALDLLWEDLDDLSPLARCLPEVSHELPTEYAEEEMPHDPFMVMGNKFSLSRLLTRTEWDILLGYTHRIRSIVEVKCRLEEESLRYLSHPPNSKLLLQNLRHLRCEYKNDASSLLCFPLPSLISLDLVFEDAFKCEEFLGSYSNTIPTVNNFCFRVRGLDDRLLRIEHKSISSWRNIQSLICPQITLDVDALAYLSRLPMLTRLAFRQIVSSLPGSDFPLHFSNLRHLTLHSPSLVAITKLLSLIRLPCITNFTAVIESCPSKKELSSLLSNLQASNANHTLENLTLDQIFPSIPADRGQDPLLLDLEDLRPCTSFTRLRSLKVNIGSNVTLGDNDLSTLTSGWPHLEHLVINAYAGWNANAPGSRAGVTPHGLLRLLHTCRNLRWIALALDTRTFTASSTAETTVDRILGSGQAPLPLPLPLRTPTLTIDVLDAVLDAESAPAVARFLSRIAPRATISLCAWRGGKMVRRDRWETYKSRWECVFKWYCRLCALPSRSDAEVGVTI